MPIASLSCPKCKESVALNDVIRHAVTCGFAAPQLAALIVRGLQGDARHDALQLTTTAGSDCPRRRILRQCFPIDVAFERLIPPTLGNALHASLAEQAFPDEIPELEVISERCTCRDAQGPAADLEEVEVDGEPHLRSCGKARCTFSGELDGLLVTGRVDAYGRLRDCPEVWKAWDWKFMSAYASRYLDPLMPKAEYKSQAYVNAYLMRRSGVNAKIVEIGMIPWSKYVGCRIEIPGDEELLDELHVLKPWEGAYSPLTLLHALDDAQKRVAAGEDPRNVLKSMPMYGRRMATDGKGSCMCGKFCDVATDCWEYGSDAEDAPAPQPKKESKYGF